MPSYREKPLQVRPLVICVIALLGGIVCGSGGHIEGWWVGLACGFLVWVYWTRRPWLWLGALGLCATWGGWLVSTQKAHQNARWERARTLPKGKLWIEGRIVQRMGWRAGQLRLLFEVQRWSRDGRGWQPETARIRLQVNADQPVWTWGPMGWLDRGDRLRTVARLWSPQWYANPGLYDPRPQRRREGTRRNGRCARDQVVVLSRGEAGARRSLSQHRTRLSFWLVKELQGAPTSGLLRALLLGDRGGLAQQWRADFGRTGTAHLLAISGLHLAIVAHLCFAMLGFVLGRWERLLWRGHHRQWAAALAAPWVLAYAALSGASPSTQRAFLMLCAVWMGLLVQRRTEATNTLALVAGVILLWDPQALFTVSFQLSFVAVAVLVWSATKPQTKGIAFVRRALAWMWQALHSSWWATLATLPLALAFSGFVPLWAPLINLLAIPLGGYAVVGLGLASLALFGLWPQLAGVGIAWSSTAAGWLLRWISWSATWVGPFRMPQLRPWEWGAYSALLATWMLRRHRRLQRVVAGAAVLCALMAAWPHTPARPTLTLHFLDIGQGDATLIQFPNGQSMLVDAGGRPYGRFSIGARVLLPHFRWMRLSRLDYAVLSHPHPDHFGGFIGLIGQLPIGMFWTTGQPGHHPAFRKLQEKLSHHKVPLRRFRQPEVMTIGGVEVRILHPFPNQHEGDTYFWSLHANDNSLVVWLRFGDIKILLTGDIEERGEALLLARWPQLRADVLKVPHHGSRTSSTAPLLRQLAPRHAVFCLGRENRYGFPHPSVLRRYQQDKIQVWRTDHHGRISLRTDGKTMHFSTHLKR